MEKLIKFLLKNMKVIILGVAVLFLFLFIIQSCRADKLEAKAILEEGKAIEAKRDFVESKKESDKKIDDLNADIKKEREAREKADAEVARIRRDSDRKDQELKNAKKLIRTLSPDELCFKLNERVPNEFSLLDGGDFHLSRRGGEITLEIFMDKERAEDKVKERDKEISTLKGNGAKFQSEIKSWADKYNLKADDLGKCQTALTASENANEALKKSIRSMKWKERGKGAVGGALFIIIIINVFGGK